MIFYFYLRLIRHHSIEVKQATSLSLRHLNLVSNAQETGSYFKTYIETSTLRNRKAKAKSISSDDLGILDVDMVNDSDEKIKHGKKTQSFMPRTAPVDNQTETLLPRIRKNSCEQISASNYLNGLKKKEVASDERSKSLRI